MYDTNHAQFLREVIHECIFEQPAREEALTALHHQDFLWAEKLLVLAADKAAQDNKISTERVEEIFMQLKIPKQNILQIRARRAGLLA